MTGGAGATAGASAVAGAMARRTTRAATPAEVAWIAVGPCALLMVAAILWLGPPLGRAFFAPGSEVFFRAFGASPEPVEHGRYVVALLGPVLLCGVVLGLAAQRLRLTSSTIRTLTWASKLATFGFLAVCLGAENDILLHTYSQYPDRFFNARTLAIAVLAPVVLLLLLRSPRVAERLARWMRETTLKRWACMAIAGVLVADWLLTGIDSDSTIANSLDNGWIQYPVNETFAVLDGRTPLVNFHAQYGQLVSYPVAVAMTVFGATLLVWTIAMATISWCAMVAVYATFRRVVGSSALALALFVPFMAVTFFIVGTHAHRLSPAGMFSLWPIRYAGPYVIAWLVARHLDGVRPQRAFLLFLAAWLVALNNPEFGAGAVLGALLALACARSVRSRAEVVRLLAVLAGGLLGALSLLSLLTLTRTGQMPRLGLLLEYPHVFGMGGWHLSLMHPIGFHTAAYVTFGAAIVVAVTRAVRQHDDRVLTGMLAWSGGFGLVAGSYYVGESEPGSMLSLFSTWFFALGLLAIVVIRSLAARSWRRPGLIELTVLFGFALALNAIPQTPFPWSEVTRLHQHAESSPVDPAGPLQSIDQQTRRGEHVAILDQLSNRIAYKLGLVNVAPYSWALMMPTRQMMQHAIEVTRAAHVHKVFIETEGITPDQLAMLRHAGFTLRGEGLLMDTPR